MKFIQLKRRKIVETWVYHDINGQYYINIYLVPCLSIETKVYCFYIKFIEEKKSYHSLDYGLYYEGLENTISVVKIWLNENL